MEQRNITSGANLKHVFCKFIIINFNSSARCQTNDRWPFDILNHVYRA